MISETISKELKKLESIIRIHHSIGDKELVTVSDLALKELTNVIACDGCMILALEPDKINILSQQGFGAEIETDSIDKETPVMQYPIQNKRAFFTGEIVNDLETGAMSCGRPINSLISVPILLNGEVIGIIYLDSLKKNAFNDEDSRFVELIAEEISLTIERSLTFSQIQKMLAE
jgi:GAF domain-containing protein